MACRRGGLSNTALSTTRRSRRRRRFPVIKSHACMARGLLVRQSLVIGVFSLIGHTTSIRAVVCLRLPVAIYVLFDAPCLQTLLWMYAVCIYILFIDMLVVLSRHVNVYYLWFDCWSGSLIPLVFLLHD